MTLLKFLNKKYGYQIIEVTITESYLNMKEALKNHMFIVEQALAAIKENGLDAYCSPIRGGYRWCTFNIYGTSLSLI